MAQIFWEQIKKELPSVGEYLEGALHVEGSVGVKGTLEVDLQDQNDSLSVKVEGVETLKVNAAGILELKPRATPPTATLGGVYYGDDDEFYFSFIS